MLDTSIEYRLLVMHHEWIEENWDRTIFETQDYGGEMFCRAFDRAVGMQGKFGGVDDFSCDRGEKGS